MAKAGMLKEVLSRNGTQDSHSVNVMVKDIPIGDIVIRENVRKDYTGIEELAESIRRHSLLQPITVYADGDLYIVKTGHRRFKAYLWLYQAEPERFHSIRCIISNAENRAVIQLVENVQRVDLSQKELYNAMVSLRDQAFTHKQIADLIGKSEKFVNNLFVGINEIKNDKALLDYLDTPGAGSIQDIIETKGIPDKSERAKLLKKRGKGEITQKELRKKAKALKESCPAKKETLVDAIPEILSSPSRTAATVAKERLHQYILDKVEDKWDDLALWEFYTWLLEQSKQHEVDHSGFVSKGYKYDKKQAEKIG
ncbi:ParB/RepB/Spo0J family partition protein [Treponema primitia]|uniref:ParB/RepB/Spo0J family partition protein n=1 Tax=Treponema primitia TaxID=88058 RepID=UPI000255586C|nr:ParB/RepB/Spo0J family partition protein [Treponema primitia]